MTCFLGNRIRRFVWFHLSFACASIISSPVLAESDFVLGVLENPQCKTTSMIAVRPLFLHNSRGWSILASNPKQWDSTVRWYFTRDDGAAGGIDTSVRLKNIETNGAFFARDNVFELLPDQQVAPVPNRAGAFTGWCESPTSLPRMVSTARGVATRNDWTEQGKRNAIPSNVLRAFRLLVASKQLCIDSDQPKRYHFRNTDVQLVNHLRTRTGRGLFALKLSVNAFECKSELGERFGVQWLHVDGGVRVVGSDMHLVDVADFDGDGRAEFVFWFSGYNEDGYILMDDSLNRRVSYIWKYH